MSVDSGRRVAALARPFDSAIMRAVLDGISTRQRLPRTIRPWARGAWVVVACAGYLAACDGFREPGRPPSIFLVVWDTTRADHLSIYGYERDTTPALAAIAAQGVVFEKAHVVGTWTIPSVASLFTGLFQHNHRIDWGNKDQRTLSLTEGATTLAEALRVAGYATALYSGQPNFMRREGFLQGFDETKRQNRRLVEHVLDFVDRNSDRPVFVVAYWKNPHARYTPNRRYDRWSDPEQPPYTIASKVRRAGDIDGRAVRSGAVTLRPKQWVQLQAKYDGELRQADAALGRL